ncbi:MAG: hypothetical protein IJZ68_14405 [Bacteroidaceae bacterium]|nr:hypothetical protein [Bacteroidaceae bacterium]
MTVYEQILSMSPEDLAWFCLTIIETTEDEMLSRLAGQRIDLDIVRVDPELRHAGILKTLLEDSHADVT